MNNTASIALSGLQGAQTRLQAAAHNLAQGATPTWRRVEITSPTAAGAGVTTVMVREPVASSPSETDVVGLLQARNSFMANLSVFRAGSRNTGSLIDVNA